MCAQVTKNSENYASGQSVSNPSVRAGVGSNPLDDVITPADGVSDIGASRTFPSSAGQAPQNTHPNHKRSRPLVTDPGIQDLIAVRQSRQEVAPCARSQQGWNVEQVPDVSGRAPARGSTNLHAAEAHPPSRCLSADGGHMPWYKSCAHHASSKALVALDTRYCLCLTPLQTSAGAGDGYNRTIKGAAVLAPLGTKAPMDIFPGATFRYRSCAAAGPAAFLRADLMAVPSTQRANASAYAIHAWARVRSLSNPWDIPFLHTVILLSSGASVVIAWLCSRESQSRSLCCLMRSW